MRKKFVESKVNRTGDSPHEKKSTYSEFVRRKQGSPRPEATLFWFDSTNEVLQPYGRSANPS